MSEAQIVLLQTELRISKNVVLNTYLNQYTEVHNCLEDF